MSQEAPTSEASQTEEPETKEGKAGEPAPPPAIEFTLVPVLRLFVMRGVVGATSVIALLVCIWYASGATITAREFGYATRMAGPAGFLLCGLTVLPEAYAQRLGRSPWWAALLTLLLSLIGWVIGYAQLKYTLELATAPGSVSALERALRPGLFAEGTFTLIAATLPLCAAVAVFHRLGRLRSRLGWLLVLSIAIGSCVVGFGRLPGDLSLALVCFAPVLLLIAVGFLMVLLGAVHWTYLSVWPTRELEPLTMIEWILYGGPCHMPGALLWVVAAFWTFESGHGGAAFGFSAVLALQTLAAGALPWILIRVNRRERAVAVLDRRLYEQAFIHFEGTELLLLTTLVRTLLQLKQVEKANENLPRLLRLLEARPDQGCLLEFAHHYLRLGSPERTIELLQAIADEEWDPEMRPARVVALAAAHEHLGCAAEALALLHTINLDSETASAEVRSVVSNNIACCLLDEGTDPERALQLAREAVNASPEERREEFLPTLGAAMLANQLDTRQALNYLQVGNPDGPDNSPFATSWHKLHLGRAHRALGNRDKAMRFLEEAIQALPSCRPAVAARAELAALEYEAGA